MTHTVYVYCYRATNDRGIYGWKCSCGVESTRTNWPCRKAAEDDAARHGEVQ